MKVLIIDDEEIICTSLKADFDRFNHGISYEVYTANSAKEAEQIYEKEKIELIISDINMPKVSGLTLIEKIRQVDKECLIFVLSAYDDFTYVRNAFICGVNDYILKPISFYELDKKLKQYIGGDSKTKEGGKNESGYPMEERKIKDVLLYMEEHIAKNLTMSNAAEFVSMSYSHFSKLFREHTGTTFPNYLLKIRMEKAKEYLKNPYIKINHIAQKVGYQNNPHHFSRDFCKYSGVSPTEYRQNQI